MNGLDHLLQMDPLPRKGARIGLVAHAASVSREGRHAVDCLRERNDWTLVRLFSPEHGFDARAAAGESVNHQRHPKWDLPIFSLYGADRSPRPEWLEDLDLVVVDLHDIGVRCYTYASTLRNVMEACCSCGLPLLVLDRPTPLAGIVDGPGLDPELRSFVGSIDLPLVYGWGQGVLAQTLPSLDPACRGIDLQVVMADGPCGPWIPPSPALVSTEATCAYPITVWSEAIPGIDVDRGGARSFQIWSMEDLPVDLLCGRLNGRSGVRVTPTECLRDGQVQPALHFSVADPASFRPVTFAVAFLAELIAEYGPKRFFTDEGTRPDFFDQLMGTRQVREALCSGSSPEEITSRWSRNPIYPEGTGAGLRPERVCE